MSPKILLALGFLALPAAAFPEMTGFVLSDDGTDLRYTTSRDRTIAVDHLADQVGFTQVRLSEDRKRLGWVALFPNCCTSYPVPLKLAVSSENGSVVVFPSSQAIFKWNFAKGSRAVVYRQEALHGPAVATYTLGRLKDGKILKSFTAVPIEESPTTAPAQAPSWTAGASDESAREKNQKKDDHD